MKILSARPSPASTKRSILREARRNSDYCGAHDDPLEVEERFMSCTDDWLKFSCIARSPVAARATKNCLRRKIISVYRRSGAAQLTCVEAFARSCSAKSKGDTIRIGYASHKSLLEENDRKIIHRSEKAAFRSSATYRLGMHSRRTSG